MRKTRTLGADYFEGLYRADPDPWKFQSSPYEAAKYADTIAALGNERAASGLEVGCSIGVLTRDLARLCDRLVATELSEIALTQARRRCVDLINVEFRLVSGGGDGMEGRFDLIVLSEVVYYWDDKDLDAAVKAVAASLQSGGRLLLVHWLGQTDYPRSADEAVAALAKRLAGSMIVETEARQDQYRLDLWRAV